MSSKFLPHQPHARRKALIFENSEVFVLSERRETEKKDKSSRPLDADIQKDKPGGEVFSAMTSSDSLTLASRRKYKLPSNSRM